MPGSTFRNPCPDGTDMSAITKNGTIYVICGPSNSFNEMWVFGPIIGVVILAICIGSAVKSGLCRRPQKKKYTKMKEFDHITVRNILTPDAYIDFLSGTLTERLKDELMLYRLKTGHEITDCVTYAKDIKNEELAAFCKNLNPASFPEYIFVRAGGSETRITI